MLSQFRHEFIHKRWKHKPGLVPWVLARPTLLFLAVMRFLPSGFVLAMADALGRVAWLSGRRRKIGRDHLQQAMPHLSARERDAVLKKSCGHLGRAAVETMIVLNRLRGPQHEQSVHVRPDGIASLPVDGLTPDGSALLPRITFEEGARELLEAQRGQGTVFIGAHLGAFEIMGAVAGVLGLHPAFPMRFPNNHYVGEALLRGRHGWGNKLIPRKGAVRKMVAHLSEGHCVMLATDQSAHHRPLDVNWFGRPAPTERAAAQMAIRLGKPLVVVWCTRKEKHSHWHVGAEWVEPAGERREASDAAVLDLCERTHRALERAILTAPEQYLWIHDRFRITK